MDHLLEVGSAVTRCAELVGRARGDENVPACPGWTVRDLAVHLGTIHRWAAATVLSGQRLAYPEPIVTEPVVEWYAGVAGALFGALQAVDGDETVPNFSRIDERARFWTRRQLHEATVHGVDLAQSLGVPEDEWRPAPSVAGDGVDEVLHIFFPRMTAKGTSPDVRSRIRLQATDTTGSWVVAPPSSPAGPPVQLHATSAADTVVRGTAADLYLALWGRVSHHRLEFDGDDGVALFLGATTP